MTGTEFNTGQFQNIYPDGIENHYWNHARNHIIYRFLRKNGLINEQMLEIGAGRGIVTKFLHDKGINITGVELAEVRPVKGTEDYFLPGTDVFDLRHEITEKISVILLLDVIEHIENPSAFINRIVEFFPNVNYILITVPARQELWTNYDEFNGHYKRYKLSDMADLRSGKISGLHSAYFFHILYPAFYVYSKWVRKRETEIISPEGFITVIHRLVSFLLQLDFLLLPNKFPGTSIITLYRLSNDQRS